MHASTLGTHTISVDFTSSGSLIGPTSLQIVRSHIYVAWHLHLASLCTSMSDIHLNKSLSVYSQTGLQAWFVLGFFLFWSMFITLSLSQFARSRCLVLHFRFFASQGLASPVADQPFCQGTFQVLSKVGF